MKITLEKLAEIVGGETEGDANPEISGAFPFENAATDHITYADSPKFVKKINDTRAGAVVIPRNAALPDTTKSIIAVENPRVAFAKILALFHPDAPGEKGIHPNACIGKGFTCGKDISVAPFVSVGKNVTLGDRVTLFPNVVIGDGVTIGDDARIYPNVTILERCRIGNRVIIHAGTVIGSDGFGFAPDGKMYHKIPHTGIVQIDDDVEIGAGNTIDRATFGKTWIQRGVKTDNLVHVAHNVTVGKHTVLVAHVGIAGSATIGDHAVLAGQVGVAGHITIGNHVTVGPQSGIAKSVPDGQIVSGSPEMPHKLWLRVIRIIPRLPEIKKRLAALEKKVASLLDK